MRVQWTPGKPGAHDETCYDITYNVVHSRHGIKFTTKQNPDCNLHVHDTSETPVYLVYSKCIPCTEFGL